MENNYIDDLIQTNKNLFDQIQWLIENKDAVEDKLSKEFVVGNIIVTENSDAYLIASPYRVITIANVPMVECLVRSGVHTSYDIHDLEVSLGSNYYVSVFRCPLKNVSSLKVYSKYGYMMLSVDKYEADVDKWTDPDVIGGINNDISNLEKRIELLNRKVKEFNKMISAYNERLDIYKEILETPDSAKERRKKTLLENIALECANTDKTPQTFAVSDIDEFIAKTRTNIINY